MDEPLLRWAGNGDLKRGDLTMERSLDDTDEFDEMGDSAGTRTKYKVNQMMMILRIETTVIDF